MAATTAAFLSGVGGGVMCFQTGNGTECNLRADTHRKNHPQLAHGGGRSEAQRRIQAWPRPDPGQRHDHLPNLVPAVRQTAPSPRPLVGRSRRQYERLYQHHGNIGVAGGTSTVLPTMPPIVTPVERSTIPPPTTPARTPTPLTVPWPPVVHPPSSTLPLSLAPPGPEHP